MSGSNQADLRNTWSADLKRNDHCASGFGLGVGRRVEGVGVLDVHDDGIDAVALEVGDDRDREVDAVPELVDVAHHGDDVVAGDAEVLEEDVHVRLRCDAARTARWTV